MAGDQDVIVVGGGIGGLTLALELHRLGIGCRVFEAVPEVTQVGVGITVLPHASRVLADLGLLDELAARSVVTRESVYYNRFGQFVYREPVGRHAGLPWPQLSIHRAELYDVLLRNARERLGPDRIVFGARCVGAEQDPGAAYAHFEMAERPGRRTEAGTCSGRPGRRTEASTCSGRPGRRTEAGACVIGCDGIHSALRRQLYPDEASPVYRGYNMWRGVTRWPPFLSGASMLRIGWYTSGKLTIYPCRDADAQGRQLMNWIAAVATPRHLDRDWGRRGSLADFAALFDGWTFDFLDVPGVFRAAEYILEYPMVDQEPLPRWSFGRVTLLGDAAHPMVPRGSNGAGQAILDCRALATALAAERDPVAALAAYEAERLPATTKVVYRNRDDAPDAILREVCLRTEDRPFDRLDDVITTEEMRSLSEGYARTSGYPSRG